MISSSKAVSEAWVSAFELLMRPGVCEITPLVVSIVGDALRGAEEHCKTRIRLDAELDRLGEHSTGTVANTIFPKSLWNPSLNRAVLYERYLKNVWPIAKKASPSGTYFYRMINYGEKSEPVNQLEHIIATWTQHGNHRHSALQISIFDPRLDHNHKRQSGFPCLHQVCFTPLGRNGDRGLAVSAFYATQYIVPKAYGNYIGLIRLGNFVATGLGLTLERFTCISAKAMLGVSKQAAQLLYNDASESD